MNNGTVILTSENYFSPFANMQYMSVSQFKAFEKCEFAAMEELSGDYKRPSTTALLVGSYVDAYFEGTIDLFVSQHPEIRKKDGSLKADYVQAEVILERLRRDDLMMQFLSGEKQVIMTGEIEGVPVKIKMDSYHPGDKIVDLKVMKDFKPLYMPGEGRLNFIEAWRYDLQGAVYQEIVRQKTGEKLPFYIAAATKEPVTDIDIFEVPQEILDVQLEYFANTVRRYQFIKNGEIEPERCGICDVCKNTKHLTRAKTWEELNSNEC